MPPEPGSPRAVTVPKISETTLPNGLRIIVVERKSVPLVSVNLMLGAGARSESRKLAGLTDMTASLLTKGTKTQTATQIAEQTEFLGSELGSGANWNTTNIGFDSTSDKVDAMMAILADVVLNPTFPQSEIDLYKSQLLDNLKQRMTQPGSLASLVATRYTFGEHSAIGTPETIDSISRDFLLEKYADSYMPSSSQLVFTGDISPSIATTIAEKYFNIWKKPPPRGGNGPGRGIGVGRAYTVEEYRQLVIERPIVNKILVVDLPNSGQASVVYAKNIGSDSFGSLFKTNANRTDLNYFPAIVANSLLGGGYSSRMNQEIRIKRGLSYGAGSSIAWRWSGGNFSTRCQTKTVSAAEVAELTIKEIDRIINESATDAELTPRKNVLTGEFGRSFETNGGISGQIQDLLTFRLDFSSLDSFAADTSKVTAQQVKDFALFNLKGGDIIIVGDYRDFKDDLAKRFPNQNIEVIKASELDLNSDTLRKAK
jgi:zinc protease